MSAVVLIFMAAVLPYAWALGRADRPAPAADLLDDLGRGTAS